MGFVANSLDCDDTTASISPNAQEICNQIDNNCNGIADDNALGAATYYADVDGDGYGDGNNASQSCSPITGRVLNALDCDDSDANQIHWVWKFASQKMTTAMVKWMTMRSMRYLVCGFGWDGYGSLSSWMPSCTQLVGYVDNIEDCNDGDQHTIQILPKCNGWMICNNQVDEA